jgi:1-acyl-sn-glycerol-3-phosphate acyltransferase
MSYLYKIIFWLLGWKIIGDVPRDQKKYIIITVPHTSNWDFIIGVMVRGILGFNSRFLGKKSLFKPPFGWLFRWLGGYPVDRSKNSKLVDQIVEIFNAHEEFVIAIAPEGTRKNVNDWKTGFYYIAKSANIPIIRSKIDRAKKQVVFFEPFWTTGDIHADLPKIKEVYA